MHRNLARKGFTLVELMTVAIIVALIAIVVLPQYGRYQLRGRRAEAVSKMAQVKGAESAVYATYKVFATCLGAIGIDWSLGGYYGISKGGYYHSYGPDFNAVARTKGALCPSSTDHNLTVGMDAFPFTRYSTNCGGYVKVDGGGGYSYEGEDRLNVTIAGFPRGPCTGNSVTDKYNSEEYWTYYSYGYGRKKDINGPSFLGNTGERAQ